MVSDLIPAPANFRLIPLLGIPPSSSLIRKYFTDVVSKSPLLDNLMCASASLRFMLHETDVQVSMVNQCKS